MVGLVIVSHSPKIAEGIKELALEMAQGYTQLYTAGGLEDGTIGTDAVRIMEAIVSANAGDGVVILADLGSGIISAETAIDLLEEDIDVRIADAPVVEGAIVAAVEANIGNSIDQVIQAAEAMREFHKQ
ncbi:MAG: PTS-dependent dihydroxyacetone kinase phosphotransferase subunit DhaM [Solobacterium sp.]|nr:PTS-dependent dihydroxyacetone kinase phosphotransferase subunit DhaM [Bacillota bacterium]MBR3358348.1 PTS-dependent dihydroxyacetone kinase phosphotransferase subunit DhaM [Solobacterium sp.]